MLIARQMAGPVASDRAHERFVLGAPLEELAVPQAHFRERLADLDRAGEGPERAP